MKVQVKICGITAVEDAEAAVRFGADALGFIFYEKSPRFVSPQKAKEIIAHLPPFIIRVGVFVNPPKDLVHERIEYLGLDRVQFHGEESPAFCQAFGSRVIKALRIKNADSLRLLEEYSSKTFLLDTYVEDCYGGTGRTFRPGGRESGGSQRGAIGSRRSFRRSGIQSGLGQRGRALGGERFQGR